MSDSPVLLITGASSGIGAATARLAAENGYRVALLARSEDKLNALAEEIGSERAMAVRCDVTSFEEQEAAVAKVLERFGRIDAVLANAGFGATRGFLEESPEHWKSMIDTNVTGCGFTVRAVLPHLLEANRGHVLLLASVAGRVVLPGSMYSVSKWAVCAMGEALRKELRETRDNHTIRVTTIEPGAVETPFFDSPPSTALVPEDVARSILFAMQQPAGVDLNEIMIRPLRGE